jgi:hypothetical protein
MAEWTSTQYIRLGLKDFYAPAMAFPDKVVKIDESTLSRENYIVNWHELDGTIQTLKIDFTISKRTKIR